MGRFFQRLISLATALLLVVAATTLQGCARKKVWRIGVSQCSTDDWRNKMNEEILRETLLHDNVEVEIRSADDSSREQISDIRYFVDNGFDIIVVAPNESRALTPVIKEVYESGTPVLVFDRRVDGDAYTAFQGADNVAIGVLAARMALNLGGEGCHIIEIRGLDGSSPAAGRHEGFGREAKRLGLNIVASASGNWSAEKARPVADSLLKAHSEADVVYAHNDRMAIAAREAARALGRGDIRIIGIDAAPAIGVTAVRDSLIDATFTYPTAGGRLLRTAVDILEGRPFQREVLLPATAAVDPSNAELILMQDNFLREETANVEALHARLDEYWQRHSQQTAALWISIGAAVLLCCVIFLLVRSFWLRRNHQRQLEERNEELARLYEQLREATASKLTFFTNVSHDLRTPLTLVCDPLAQMAKAENLTPSQRQLMQLADKNAKRMMRLVNQILDIRKHDASHLALNPSRVNLADAMREWTAAFTNAAAKRHIAFITDIPSGPDFVTAVDIEKTERVLFNLLSNAFKFTPENGRVCVALRRERDTLVLSVTDTGCGIPEDELRQVFDRFFKTDRVNPSGSGIGLALTKIFVEMHGGDISVSSDPGKGTVFEVRLPVNDAEVPEADLAPSVAKSLTDAEELTLSPLEEPEIAEDAPVVLVIDDNADIRTFVKHILCDNFTVLQASSGAQGVRLASKYVPDLVICDVMMPGIDGYETCRRLKGEPVTSHIPVLLLTACSRDEHRTEAYDSGADAFMSKPFDSQMLLTRCRSLIDNRRRILENGAPGAQTAKPVPAGESVQGTAIDDEFYARFVRLVEQEMADSELTVEDLAAKIGISRVQMYRKLKAVTNYSPAELLRNIRLDKAARLLKTTDTTVAEAAYAVGFTAPNHFTRCYKRRFGELPTETQMRTVKLR